MEEIKKRKIYIRATENLPPLEIQERDRKIIDLVYNFRYLTSDQVTELVEGSKQIIKRRLHKLFHHGFLSRPKQGYILRVLKGRTLPLIYGIGPKARKILVERGYDLEQVKASMKEANYLYLEHSLEVTDFHLALLKAIKEKPDWKIIFWKNEGKETRRSWEIGEEETKRRLKKDYYVINPDAYFCLEGPDKEAVKGRAKMYFFLEADRGTVSYQRWRWKVESYSQLWRERKHLEKPYFMEMVPLKRGETIIDAYPNFKVVTVTITPERKEALRRETIKADPKGQGLRIFWFGESKEYQRDYQKILEPIFQLAKGEQSYSLLERYFK